MRPVSIPTRRPVASVLAAAALIAFAPTASAAPFQVSMSDDYFAPANATVAQGKVVRWRNYGTDQHDTISEQYFWASPLLRNGQTFSRAFNAAGTYRYLCSEHEDMTGSVLVRPKVTASGRRFTITVSATVAPSGYRHVVQRRNPGSSTWVTLTPGTTARTVVYNGPVAGRYSFRAAYKRLSPVAQSNWSPPKALTVS